MKFTLPHFDNYEPIALVGVGCRFSGGIDDVESFWAKLLSGEDAIVTVPPERWNLKRFYDPDPGKPGKLYMQAGGFIEQPIDKFDATFFGIAPREAECMDPQQRLLLETSWEALEDAGIPADTLAGSDTGVFIGAFTLDHKLTQMGSSNRDLIGTHTAIGSTMTILSNRISYFLDLRGPSMSLDTACSSSLVAVHLACQSIWRGECALALAGGVNIMTRPEYPVAMCKGGFLAKDGRSKSFDARADGYGRGEGAGVVVLKPLSAALQDKDNIYALIRGSGVNQDGRTNGITVPNAESQAALIRQVCDTYAIDPADIQYIEAHGTGTPVGDPLEAKALGSVIGAGRKADNPCLVGSIKSTIGHTEAAAGVAGLIKTALCLKHRKVPPQANLDTPNPAIPFAELGLRLPRVTEPLAPDANQVLACVNSFGYGGTNAHVVLQSAQAAENNSRTGHVEAKRIYTLPLSARSEAALEALAGSWQQYCLNHADASPEDFCYSAACRRSHHSYRLAVTGQSAGELAEELALFIKDKAGEWQAHGKLMEMDFTRPVFVYTGMGPQWWAMGRELFDTEPVFRDMAECCDAIFRKIAGWSILQEMLADESASRMRETVIAQPANFVLQVALTALWRERGIEPAAVVGHSVGEVTAAYVAGVLSLEEAVKVSYHRSQIQQQAAGTGGMLAIGISAGRCAELLVPFDGLVSIAAINGPEAITLAGDTAALGEIAEHLTSIGEFNRMLQVEVPYHSHYMEPLKPLVRETLASLQPRLPTLPLYSTVTGERVDPTAGRTVFDAEYWCDNIREPVYFAQAMFSLLRDGHRVFLEIGPHPVLSTAIRECCRAQSITPQTFTSMKRGQPEQRTFALALAGLYTAGCAIDWQKQFSPDARYVRIPLYPWQREVYWREDAASMHDRIGIPLHPLLDQRLSAPLPTWQTSIHSQFLPYLTDHRVDGLVVMPAAAYVEACLAAQMQLAGEKPCIIEQLSFQQALIIDPAEESFVHVTLDAENGEFAFFSRNPQNHFDWLLHATGKTSTQTNDFQSIVSLETIADRCPETVDIDRLYADLRQRGLDYGPAFRTITHIRRGRREILAKIELNVAPDEDSTSYQLHPTLLDGCFQSLIACLEDDERFYMPVAIERLVWLHRPSSMIWCHGRVDKITSDGITGQLDVYDETGKLCVSIEAIRCRALASRESNIAERIPLLGYVWEWQRAPLQPDDPNGGPWLVFTSEDELASRLCQRLENETMQPVIQVDTRYVFQQQAAMISTLDRDQLDRVRTLLQLAREKHCRGIAYLWGREPSDPAGIGQGCAALQVMQLLNEVFTGVVPRLYFITQSLHPVENRHPAGLLSQAAVAGFARVALNEYPAFRVSLIDIDQRGEDASIDPLLLELLANSAEDDVALRGDVRYVHRLVRMTTDTPRGDTEAITTVKGSEVEAFRLDWEDTPHFREMTRFAPDEYQVEVELGYVNLPGLSRPLTRVTKPEGYFATGRIARTGSKVTQWQTGDRVIVVSHGLPASHVCVDTAQVFSLATFGDIPEHCVVSLITSLLPAYYSLNHVMRIRPGETVLIDADSGDCALSFHHAGLWLGAAPVLYSSEDTRLQMLEARSDLTVIDARQTDLTETLATALDVLEVRAWVHAGNHHHDQHPVFRQLAQQHGVHEIVIDQVETKKPEIIGACGSCSHVCVLTLALTSSALFNRILLEMAQHLQRNRLPATGMLLLSGEEFLQIDGRMAPDASSTLIPILSLADRSNIPVITQTGTVGRFDAQSSHLITGGFGGFGLELAFWLVKQGVRHLILVGRRGAADESTRHRVEALRNKGAVVLEAAVDIADAGKLAALLERIDNEMPPLKGIWHAAAVLDDAPIAELTEARMRQAMLAKAQGAWHLHQLTQKFPLDHFVLFSTVSALIGNSRQANYAAANTFLDALAWQRHAMGLPATSVNWGAIETGMAIDNEIVRKHLALMGMHSLPAKQALDCWLQLASQPDSPAQYALMDVDWPRWQEFEPTGGHSPRFLHLMETCNDTLTASMTLMQELDALPEDERVQCTEDHLCTLLAQTLRMNTEKIDRQRSLAQMGVDSLMAAELQAGISRMFGTRLSTLELMRAPSIAHLAALLLEKNCPPTESTVTPPEQQTTASELLARLSTEELDGLLQQLLNEKEPSHA